MSIRSRWILAAALVLGCGGSGPTGLSQGGKTLTASYNGTAWTPTNRQGVWQNGNLSISGNDGTRSLSIAALNINGPGTYSLGPGNPNTAVANWIDPTNHYRSITLNGSGTITLTAVSLGRIAGTFSFVATALSNTGAITSVTITNGQFDLTIP